jgi:O-antigen/teichoic acid export membrane protein
MALASWPRDLSQGDIDIEVTVKSLLLGSVILILYRFNFVAFQNVGILMINFVTQDSTLTGIFQVGNIIGKIAQFTGMALVMSLFPLISRAVAQGDSKQARELLTRAIGMQLIVNLPVGIYLIYDAELVVNILFGSQFEAASDLVAILYFSYLFGALVSVTGSLAVAQGKYLLAMRFGMLLSISGILFAFVFSYALPVKGVAFGLLCGGILAFVYAFVVMREHIHWVKLFHIIFKILLASTLAVAIGLPVALVFPGLPILIIPIAGLAYLFILWKAGITNYIK